MGGINHARIETSDRLRRVLAVLADGREYTTLDLMAYARVCAVSTAVAELRANGFSISCQRRGDLWFYRMEVDNG
jgi:hypothetical protein